MTINNDVSNEIAIVLQKAIAQLGPIPDEYGPIIKSIMANPNLDVVKTLALAYCLYLSRQRGDYKPLDKISFYKEKFEKEEDNGN